MELRLLRYFVAVYEEKSITRASERHFISQPSLSSAIRQLEDMLGVELFLRHKKGVDLTDEAHHLYPAARKLLRNAEELSVLFSETPAPIQVRLGLFPDLSPSHLKNLLSHIRRTISGIELELVDHDMAAPGRITLDILKREEELFIPLWEEDYLVCLPTGHSLASEEVITPEMLHSHPFIECPPCEAHQQTMGILANEGMGLNIACRAEHKSQVLHLIQGGYGISFLPEGVVEYGTEVETRPFSGPRMFRRIGLCTSSSAEASSVMSRLVQVVEELRKG